VKHVVSALGLTKPLSNVNLRIDKKKSHHTIANKKPRTG